MIKCSSGFRLGDFECTNNFVGGVPSQARINYSILMDIGHQYCNACCKYCCCHPVPATGDSLYKYFKKDFEKMFVLIEETDKKRNHFNDNYVFEIWGGEPLLNTEAFKETFSALKEKYPKSIFSTSTNGLILNNDDICDFLIKNKIYVQLSHDGKGQRLRTGNVEPLEGKSGENIEALVQLGVITGINCTLSSVNPSWFENIDFWNSYFKRWHKEIPVKLNHPYDSDYAFDFAFTNEKTLRKYFSEFISLYWTCYYNKNAYKPYRNYILEQGGRWKEAHDDCLIGSCRAYQSYKHNIEGNAKQDWNFVITTTGEYAECNLSEKVDNPGGVQPDYCKDCKYKDQAECKHCGAMNYPKKCVYGKAWMETLENITRVREEQLKNGTNHKCFRPK